MGFFDHLGELRTCILRSVVGMIIGSILCGYFINEIMNALLLHPATAANVKLQNLRPFGQAFLYFKVIVTAGVIVSTPYTIWNLWTFVAPGLYDTERSWARSITLFTTFCFACGLAFAYFVMIPNMMSFTNSFGTAQIENNIDVNEYFGFLTTTLLSAGLIFELPMISFVLTRMGIISPEFLRKYRRHSIIIILIVAAILTPTPDPINQLFMAVPLYILFEISIVVSSITKRKQVRA